jgi:hypothetical protein
VGAAVVKGVSARADQTGWGMSDALIEVEHFSDATSFLTALHPSSEPWLSSPERWIYRGHRDGGWKVVPSAFRDGAFAQFVPAASGFNRLPENARSATELFFLRQFCEGLDRAGLPIPGITRAELSRLLPETPASPQWPRHYVEVAAFAQHYGIPTRLLDFSTFAFVAAVDERITGATMFPGVDGVVRAMREQAVHRRFQPL